jgi:hypothetical protein
MLKLFVFLSSMDSVVVKVEFSHVMQKVTGSIPSGCLFVFCVFCWISAVFAVFVMLVISSCDWSVFGCLQQGSMQQSVQAVVGHLFAVFKVVICCFMPILVVAVFSATSTQSGQLFWLSGC